MNQQRDANAHTDSAPAHPRRRRRRGGLRVRNSSHIALSMTAMIDVVFLLLIYFMVATDFRLTEEFYRVELPQQGAAAAADPFTLDEAPLRISISSTGIGPGMYRLRLDGPYPQPQTFDELHEFLHDRQVNETTMGGLFTPDHPILVQPTRHTRWEHAMEAFNAAARARYSNITFAKAP